MKAEATTLHLQAAKGVLAGVQTPASISADQHKYRRLACNNNKDNLSVYNIRKRYCATLLSCFKKAQYRTCLDIRDLSSCCYHDQARGPTARFENIRYYIRNFNFKSISTCS